MTERDIDAIVATMEAFAGPLAMLARATERCYPGRYEIGVVMRENGRFEGTYLLPLDEDPPYGPGAADVGTMPDEVLLVLDADARQTAVRIMTEVRDWAETERTKRRCRRCGCTDEAACSGGCYWVASDLCSSCAGDADMERSVAG